MKPALFFSALTAGLCLAGQAQAGLQFYGDQDLLGTGSYSSDPTAGATLSGLAAGSVTYASLIQGHSWPFSPSAGDYPGTDQIYVGSTQTGSHDGYSGSSTRLNGPQVITLNYSSLVPAGETISTFTLGIAADDFQNIPFGQPFTASINGVANTSLTAVLNGLNQTGPVTQFFTLGLDTSLLNGSQTLTLSINQLGDGGDGWAIDYLSVGVTTVPEPSALAVLIAGGAAFLATRRSIRP
jgi:hypothetical protein